MFSPFQVSLDNLHRQVGHKEKNVGKKKTESLRDALHELEITSDIRDYLGISD